MSATARFAVVLAVAAAVPSQALAWKHIRMAWNPEDFPLQYEISDYNEDSVPEGYTVTAIQAAYAEWEFAECAEIPTEFAGTTPQNTPFTFDFANRHSFDDPGDRHAPGVLGVTLSWPGVGVGSPMFVRDGQSYYRTLDADIVYNDNVDWGTEEDMDVGCAGETSLLAVAVHEIGHSFGLGHSCDQEDACRDPELLEATMYWTAGSCSSEQSTIATDDIEGLQALYGPFATFRCSNELDPGANDTLAVGIVDEDGFTLRCVVQSDTEEELTDAEWFFGDGGTATTLDAEHTYTEPGNYTIRVCFNGNNDECGDYTYCYRREGYVRACGVPETAFTVEHVNGRTWRFLNQTDLSVYGCIYDVQWDVFKGNGNQPIESIVAWEPEFTFPEDGEYRVVLNVGGPAGTSAQEAIFEVKNRPGEGYGACNTAGSAAGGGAVLALIALLGIRRRKG